MNRLLSASAFLVLCACATPEPVVEYPSSERELWSRSETIDAQAALSIVGLERSHEKDDGSGSWSSRLIRLEPRRATDGAVHPFRLVITNDSTAPIRLDARLELRDEGEVVVRARRLPPLLVSPWQRTEFIGIVRAPSASGRLVANVQRTDHQESEQ